MSEKTPLQDFEGSWQTKLKIGLDQHLDPVERNRILVGGERLTMESSPRERTVWTCEMIRQMDDVLTPAQIHQIFTTCHCSYPPEDLLEVKLAYRLYGDIDLVLNMLQDKFEFFLRDVLALDDEIMEKIIEKGWGLAGIRDGNQIIATKIPKSGYLVEYFETEDPVQKRKLYCHCPRVRDLVGEEPRLPQSYCYCGAGFYQEIWEIILGEPVQVEVLESVIAGGDVCQIAIHLPPSRAIDPS